MSYENPDLRSVLSVDFRRAPGDALRELLKVCSTIRSEGESAAQNAFGYFLARYAIAEDGSSASVGYTPTSISSLIAAVLDVRRGRVLDPLPGGATYW